MVQWATFTGITGVVLVLLLVLSHLTQTAFTGDSTASADDSSPASDSSDSSTEMGPATGDPPTDTISDAGDTVSDTGPTRADSIDTRDSSVAVDGEPVPDTDPTAATASDTPERPSRASFDGESGIDEFDADRPRQPPRVDPESLSTGELLANVALSQGLFALVLLGAVIYTGIPADALGIEFSVAYLEQGLVLGVAVGLVLYVANEIGAAAATRFGFDHDEKLRELLAPDSMQGWVVLLLAVLPIIAFFEELLFRAALIGVVSAGFGISPWLLAVVSSVAFAVGHGIQGSVGVVVTGALGFVLAAIYILTGSFLVVVVAHYLINALEFAVHEGLDFEWTEILEH